MSRPGRLAKLTPIRGRDRVRRLLWRIVRLLMYSPTPVYMHRWRCSVLRAFGANVHESAFPYPDAKIWAPWNLVMNSGSCLGPNVECYNVALVHLGRDVTVSQRSHLCTASHDYNDPKFPLTGAPIVISDGAWIAAEAFVGPGVRIGARAVVLARSVIVNDVEPSAVMGGNPARHVRDRAFNSDKLPRDETI